MPSCAFSRGAYPQWHKRLVTRMLKLDKFDASGSDLNLTISIQGFDLTLKIARAVITMKVGADGQRDGRLITGVIPLSPLIELKEGGWWFGSGPV